MSPNFTLLDQCQPNARSLGILAGGRLRSPRPRDRRWRGISRNLSGAAAALAPTGAGTRGGHEQVALAFSQRRVSFPRQGAPRILPIFFDLVLDTHHCRRHFRLAGKLDSNSRSLLELGRYFFTVPVKNENGCRNRRHFVGIALTAFSLSCRGGRDEERDCRDKECSVHGALPPFWGY